MSDLFRGITPLKSALDFHLSRHNVLSSNIANAETPGFRPLELVRDAERPQPVEGGLPMRVTAEGHIGPSAIGGRDYEIREERVAAPGANGNAVSLEHEMSKLAANDIRYEGAVKIVSSQLAMLRYAANDGAGT